MCLSVCLCYVLAFCAVRFCCACPSPTFRRPEEYMKRENQQFPFIPSIKYKFSYVTCCVPSLLSSDSQRLTGGWLTSTSTHPVFQKIDTLADMNFKVVVGGWQWEKEEDVERQNEQATSTFGWFKTLCFCTTRQQLAKSNKKNNDAISNLLSIGERKVSLELNRLNNTDTFSSSFMLCIIIIHLCLNVVVVVRFVEVSETVLLAT